jgi:hypothetical protein
MAGYVKLAPPLPIINLLIIQCGCNGACIAPPYRADNIDGFAVMQKAVADAPELAATIQQHLNFKHQYGVLTRPRDDWQPYTEHPQHDELIECLGGYQRTGTAVVEQLPPTYKALLPELKQRMAEVLAASRRDGSLADVWDVLDNWPKPDKNGILTAEQVRSTFPALQKISEIWGGLIKQEFQRDGMPEDFIGRLTEARVMLSEDSKQEIGRPVFGYNHGITAHPPDSGAWRGPFDAIMFIMHERWHQAQEDMALAVAEGHIGPQSRFYAMGVVVAAGSQPDKGFANANPSLHMKAGEQSYQSKNFLDQRNSAFCAYRATPMETEVIILAPGETAKEFENTVQRLAGSQPSGAAKASPAAIPPHPR